MKSNKRRGEFQDLNSVKDLFDAGDRPWRLRRNYTQRTRASRSPALGSWDEEPTTHHYRRQEVIQNFMRRQNRPCLEVGPVPILRVHFARVCPEHRVPLEHTADLRGREVLYCPVGHTTRTWSTACIETGEVEGRWSITN